MLIIGLLIDGLLLAPRLKRIFYRKSRNACDKSPKEPVEVNVGTEEDDDMYVERIHIENMNLGFVACL